ncbi:hypothetical protein KRR26_00315 [Corallococcus sp. M34]|nr:hypothetical protein [Citreicoccus inhibens]
MAPRNSLLASAKSTARASTQRCKELQAITAGTATSRPKAARVALAAGAVGLVVAPRGRLYRILRFTLAAGRITRIDVIGETADLHALTVSTLDA